MQMMNPYFAKNESALPKTMEDMVKSKDNSQDMVNHIKSLCYDMMLSILDEAENDGKTISPSTSPPTFTNGHL